VAVAEMLPHLLAVTVEAGTVQPPAYRQRQGRLTPEVEAEAVKVQTLDSPVVAVLLFSRLTHWLRFHSLAVSPKRAPR
jgi:hypothetical protein